MKLARSAALVTSAVIALMAPAAAHADVFVGYDATKDVKFAPPVEDDESTGGAMLGAPQRVLGDITRIRVEHTLSKVRVSMKFRALAAAGQGTTHTFGFKSTKGSQSVTITAGPGRWLGHAGLVTGGAQGSCLILRHRIDYTHDLVIIEVPRSCLGSPSSVQVYGESRIRADGGYYADWPLTSGYPGVWTPRVPL